MSDKKHESIAEMERSSQSSSFHKMTPCDLFDHMKQLREEVGKIPQPQITVVECDHQKIPVYIVAGFDSREEALYAANYARAMRSMFTRS